MLANVLMMPDGIGGTLLIIVVGVIFYLIIEPLKRKGK